MKNNWIKVFCFTFRKNAGTKGYVITTAVVALALLIIIPAAILIAVGNEDVSDAQITRTIVVNSDLPKEVTAAYGDISIEYAADVQTAAGACEGDPGAVIVVIENDEVIVIVPDSDSIDRYTAEALASHIATSMASAGTEPDEAELAAVSRISSAPEISAEDEGDMLQEIVGMIAPYVVLMLMYFMVLIYGQSAANNAIMEKTSKLMDMFLVSLKPSQLIVGKTFACAAAGLVQMAVWIASAAGGCALGKYIVTVAYPGSGQDMLALFERLGVLAAMLDPAALVTAVLMIVVGFLLYCSLAGFGGALASKPEELGSTNQLFTIALIVSFLVCMFTGESAGMISEAPALAYIPFTAVLSVPGRLLTGSMSVFEGLVSIAITAAASVAVMIFAGKAYTAMAFYRGRPLNPLKMLRSLIIK